MKRSSFLKSLLGIAVAPIAAAKIIEEISKPKEIYQNIPNKVYPREILSNDIGYTWYDNEIEKTNAEFNMRFEHFIMNREPSEINSSTPSLLDNEKLT
ncbi:hypothetical protein Phi46:3_gp017 [Cellulophaga phage phi46:3]|uniref:Uncharacterized protein n=1 Tax=Cellulophaga phage phi46:3 TaxID=1327985 RepID=S0A067_9CAUD|nr:hypothetical protein Phi46:3_gp017 [Cellulophaga phage phi46:3]AGO48761.1 hypothetical protein Phi46:3_gp017 [Cellulophaga phage phi46:3]